MKKIYTLALILLATSIGAISCEGILNENPKDVVVEQFYNNPTEAEAGVSGIYTNLRSAFGDVYPMTLEALSDYFQGRTSWADISDFQGLEGGNRSATEGFWLHFYKSISNANHAIKHLPNATNLSEEEINRYVAEARFLRALNYFHLVRGWGAVPLRTEDNMDIRDLPQSPVDEVYTLIKDDLHFAESYLTSQPSAIGRATRWAAKAVLAHVHFTLHENDDARNLALEIIQSGEFSLVEVSEVDDFMNLFGPDAAGNSEEIFHLQFNRDAPWGYNRYLTGDEPSYLSVPGYWIITSQMDLPFYENWDDTDLRKEYSIYSQFFAHYGTDRYLSRKFRDPVNPWGTNNHPLYRYADVLLLFAEADALVQGSPTAEGMEKLNMVHRRAYGYNPISPSPVDFNLDDYSDLNQFVEIVIKERGQEQHAEAKRWYDLKRSGKLHEYIMEAYGIEVAERALLFPIPSTEINFNSEISEANQNPGY